MSSAASIARSIALPDAPIKRPARKKPATRAGRIPTATRKRAKASKERDLIHLSTILERFEARADKDKISFKEVFENLGTSSFGVSLAISSVPEVIPLPFPGATEAVVLPSVLISSQMLAGKDQLVFPQWLLRKEVSAKLLKRISRMMLPAIRKMEKLSKPRGRWIETKLARRMIGALVLLLAAIIALPIPGTNIPPAIAIFVIGLGLVERDERIVIAGMLLGILSAVLIGGAVAATLAALVPSIFA